MLYSLRSPRYTRRCHPRHHHLPHHQTLRHQRDTPLYDQRGQTTDTVSQYVHFMEDSSHCVRDLVRSDCQLPSIPPRSLPPLSGYRLITEQPYTCKRKWLEHLCYYSLHLRGMLRELQI